ncbi:MAG: type II secretion system protein [Verrucomicrobiae bacterium]|nr:type II secretion system protein [Verrucomicrobiae bacterium]
MKRLSVTHPLSRLRAYTLIEALVASSILAIGMGAASSMSLALITQEQITERSEKAIAYLENAALLYQAGIPESQITALLPPEPVVTSLTLTPGNLTVSNHEPMPSTLLTVTWKPSDANSSSGVDRWTGGSSTTSRSASINVIRVNPTLASPLPRVDFFD